MIAPVESVFSMELVSLERVVDPTFETEKRVVLAPLLEVEPTEKTVESTDVEAACTESVA